MFVTAQPAGEDPSRDHSCRRGFPKKNPKKPGDVSWGIVVSGNQGIYISALDLWCVAAFMWNNPPVSGDYVLWNSGWNGLYLMPLWRNGWEFSPKEQHREKTSFTCWRHQGNKLGFKREQQNFWVSPSPEDPAESSIIFSITIQLHYSWHFNQFNYDYEQLRQGCSRGGGGLCRAREGMGATNCSQDREGEFRVTIVTHSESWSSGTGGESQNPGIVKVGKDL